MGLTWFFHLETLLLYGWRIFMCHLYPFISIYVFIYIHLSSWRHTTFFPQFGTRNPSRGLRGHIIVSWPPVLPLSLWNPGPDVAKAQHGAAVADVAVDSTHGFKERLQTNGNWSLIRSYQILSDLICSSLLTLTNFDPSLHSDPQERPHHRSQRHQCLDGPSQAAGLQRATADGASIGAWFMLVHLIIGWTYEGLIGWWLILVDISG